MHYFREYNNLESEVKANFLELHAPMTLGVNRVLVRKYRAIYVSHLKRWRMPTKEELMHYNEVPDIQRNDIRKKYKNFMYEALPVKQVNKLQHLIEQGQATGDKRGAYIDLDNNIHRGICRVGNFYIEIVEDLDKEIEFLETLFVKPIVPPAAVKTVKEVATEEQKEVYAKYKEDMQRLSKKEFAKENNISVRELNKIIKINELDV